MEYEDRVRIATPEGVELDLALAGVGSRLAARIIDFTLQIAIAVAALAGLGSAFGGSDSGNAAVAIAAIVITFAIFWGYNVVFETFNSGRTPGKIRCGLRVVGDAGEPETFSMSAVRNLFRIIDEFATAFLVGPIAIVASKRNQRVGDMAAGTLVVKERAAESKVDRSSVSANSIPKLDAARQWDLTGVTPQEQAAVRRFLERRSAISPRARAGIAQDLAARLRPKIPNSDQVGADEHFLELVSAVKRER